MIHELVRQNRSYRRFREDESIDMNTLRSLVDLARLSPSARNLQPLKYIISNSRDTNALIFPLLAWAGYLTDWHGAEEGERPAAYVIMLADKNITQGKTEHDEGIAAQSILLGAAEKGLGGCIVASVKRNELAEALRIPQCYGVCLVIALGKPVEEVEITNVKNDDIRYFRDNNAVHYVPKRSLDDIILNF